MASPPEVGAFAPSSPEVNGLRIGTRIGEFEVMSRLGEGGFSVVYLAWDHSLERNVALKEYMPMSIASRVDNTQIAPMTERHRETFDAALASFINEGKLLAQFDHPSLVKVYRFWEANGTAYMVMPFYEGRTLRDTIRALDQPPDEAWFIGLLQPLTRALSVIHAANCFHRDIAPDNVMLLAGSGAPLLLDFGAARRVIGDRTQALTAILKPGYAPIEQYAEVPHLRQGSWTDVYALAAVLYWAIKGSTPPSAVGRMLKDSYVPLAGSVADRYSQRFLQAIDRALKVLPEDRTQTIDALRLDMGLEAADCDMPAESPRPDADATVLHVAGRSTTMLPLQASEVTVFSGVPTRRQTTGVRTEAPTPSIPEAAVEQGDDAAPAVTQTIPARVVDAPAATHSPVAAPAPVADARRSRPSPMLASIAGLLVIAGAAGTWWWLQQPSTVDTPPAVADSTLPSPGERQGASSPTAETPATRVEPPPPVMMTPATIAPPLAPIGIDVAPLRSPYELGAEPLQLEVKADAAGYLYLFGHRQGSNELRLLLPADSDSPIELTAGTARRVEVPSKWLDPKTPGTWNLWVVASRTRHELNGATWSVASKRFAASLDLRNPNDRVEDWVDPFCGSTSGPCDRAIGVRRLALSTESVPRPVVKAPAIPPRAAAAPAPAPAVAERRPAPAAAPPAPAKPPQSAECARLMQRMSIGDGGVELAQRMEALGCR